MSAASSLFGLIESSNPNPATAADFQQGSGFQQQFGAGAAGFDNWLAQALQNNPTLTLGDAYAQYNSGTGTPGIGHTFEQLAGINPAAYANASGKIAAAGYSPATPIAALTGGGLPLNDAAAGDGAAAAGCAPTDSVFCAMTGIGAGQGTTTAGNPKAAAAAAAGQFGGFFPAVLDSLTVLFQRGALVIFGLVLLAAGAWLLAKDQALPMVSKSI